jgi:SAM-dependent methyltransferase
VGLVERELTRLGVVNTWDLYDLSPRVLRRAKRSMGMHRRRVTTHVADINRVTLRHDAYNLILCFTSLHHFVELERILDEIAGALTRNGLFLVWDFVGENRMQWSEARIAFQQALLEDIPAEFRVSPDARIKPTDTLTMSPFDAVRSADIPALLRARFRPECWKTFCGALVPLLLYLRAEDIERARPDILERLFIVDRELSDNPSPDFVNPVLCALLRRF